MKQSSSTNYRKIHSLCLQNIKGKEQLFFNVPEQFLKYLNGSECLKTEVSEESKQ